MASFEYLRGEGVEKGTANFKRRLRLSKVPEFQATDQDVANLNDFKRAASAANRATGGIAGRTNRSAHQSVRSLVTATPDEKTVKYLQGFTAKLAAGNDKIAKEQTTSIPKDAAHRKMTAALDADLRAHDARLSFSGRQPQAVRG